MATKTLSIRVTGFYAQIWFHFQQAAEKYLKAFIVAHDLKFEKQHKLLFFARNMR